MALVSLYGSVLLLIFMALSRILYLCVYRLWLSPLSKFPGPTLAALTSWYEIFYDLIKDGGGLYIWEVEKMHKKYGISTTVVGRQSEC